MTSYTSTHLEAGTLMRGFQLGREPRRTAVATEIPAEGRIDSDSSGPGPPSNKDDSVLGKVHGSLARAGKVKSQTPKVAKQEKKKKLTGRAKKRDTYKRRFVNVTNAPGGKRRMNVNPESTKG
ncbi:hypothetical protein BGZ88_009520 [Linnemannia elongata]|nr:hypothetical protein BGZ88_009520 [Linnemannia elongata]